MIAQPTLAKALIGIVMGGTLPLSVLADYIVLIIMPVAQLGLASGPLFGGILTQYGTRRWCKCPNSVLYLVGVKLSKPGFCLNLPVVGLVVMLVFVRIPQQHPTPPSMLVLRSLHSSLDLLGFAIFAPALVMLLLALQGSGMQYAWNGSQRVGLTCGSGATFIVFLFWKFYNGDATMLPVSIARRRTFWTNCIVYVLFMGN